MTLPRLTFPPAHFASPVDALRALAPDLPNATLRIIDGYAPRRRTSAWDHVRPFVVECVLQMEPTTPVNARRLMTMTALYVSWVWSVTGCAITIPRMFQTHLMHRYDAEQLTARSDAYRYDTVRQLSSMAERLADVHVQRLHTPNTPCARPYSPVEVAALYSWANTLTTNLKRRNAQALLALSGGAGLSAQELMDVQVEDVEFTDGRAFVLVRGARARRVAVHSQWLRTLVSSIGDRTCGDLFHAYRLEEYKPNGLQTFLSDNPGPIRASSARLRSGWIVAQIDAGLPVPVLLEITGFTTLQTLQPYLAHCMTHQMAHHVARITGEEVA